MIPEEYSFTRYLEAKKSVDDRALNRYVWESLASKLSGKSAGHPIKVLEIGAGIGTMVARMLEWGLLQYAEYTGIDNQNENIQHARLYLKEWAERQSFDVSETNAGMLILGKNTKVRVNLLDADLYKFMDTHPAANWDLVVAHAFLDLVSLPDTLRQIFNLGQKNFLYYFTINYDGLTILEPVIDAEFDNLLLSLYHSTMKERIKNGVPFGDHQTGRHLIDYIPRMGGRILSAGSSDWVVIPGSSGYPMDEAFFLHFIINTINEALMKHPQLDSQQFAKWIELRHAQIEREELIFIAHQMDFFGTVKDD